VNGSDAQVLRLASNEWRRREARWTRRRHAVGSHRNGITTRQIAFVPHFSRVERWRGDGGAPRPHRGKLANRDAELPKRMSRGLQMDAARRRRWRHDRCQQQRQRDERADGSTGSPL